MSQEQPIDENSHDPLISVEIVNEFLDMQKGRCIRCGRLFQHCGGSTENIVFVPCECCFRKMDGLICSACAEGKQPSAKK